MNQQRTAILGETIDSHIVCPKCSDTVEVTKMIEKREQQRLTAAIFHGIIDHTRKKIVFITCEDCNNNQ